MKKKIIILSIFIVIVVAVLVFIFLNNKKNKVVDIDLDIKANPNFVSLGTYDDLEIEDGYVFTSYDDYVKKINIPPHVSSFSKYAVNEEDFDKNNYVFIKINYDTCTDSDITPTDYKINGKKIDVTIKYKASCGVCAPDNMYFLLKVDKEITEADLNVDYVRINSLRCDPNVAYKPLIYIYPTIKTDVTVKLGYPNLLTTTYPKYYNSWKVTALPDGSLYDNNGRYYYGLYWEGLNSIEENFDDGYVLAKDEIISFLEEKLSILGLNGREINEFIIYWLPILESNNYNLIRFADISVINKEMPLSITPKPDTVIRVLMEYKPLDKKISIKEQDLTKVERNGFTVVEWGGTLVK